MLEVGCWDVQHWEGAEHVCYEEILISFGGLRFSVNFTCMSSVLTGNCVFRLNAGVLAIPAVRAAIVGVVRRRRWMPCLTKMMLTAWRTN